MCRVFDVGLGDDDRIVNAPAIEQISRLMRNRDKLRTLAEKVFSNDAVANEYLRAYQAVLTDNGASWS